jgi:hypothetical protein
MRRFDQNASMDGILRLSGKKKQEKILSWKLVTKDIAYTLRSNAMWFKECVFEIFLSERQLRWRMIMSVDSIGRRNTCLQSTCRSLETQCLSRTLIQA